MSGAAGPGLLWYVTHKTTVATAARATSVAKQSFVRLPCLGIATRSRRHGICADRLFESTKDSLGQRERESLRSLKRHLSHGRTERGHAVQTPFRATLQLKCHRRRSPFSTSSIPFVAQRPRSRSQTALDKAPHMILESLVSFPAPSGVDSAASQKLPL